jgi:uncharacterized protein (TIGR02117 family)
VGKAVKRLGLFIAVPFFVVALYLFAALLGGVIPSGKTVSNDNEVLDTTIYLSANALHADIAIPVDAVSREQFDFLKADGFPLDNPNLKYLIIGWGSRDFYTSTAEYSDMDFATIWRAATGDASVMHVAPGGDISKSDNAVPIAISQAGLERMIDFMLESFSKENGKPMVLPDATFGYGDLFYEAVGRFHIFNPCNVWVSKALSRAGVSTGLWTPTTYSLLLHNWVYR